MTLVPPEPVDPQNEPPVTRGSFQSSISQLLRALDHVESAQVRRVPVSAEPSSRPHLVGGVFLERVLHGVDSQTKWLATDYARFWAETQSGKAARLSDVFGSDLLHSLYLPPRRVQTVQGLLADLLGVAKKLHGSLGSSVAAMGYGAEEIDIAPPPRAEAHVSRWYQWVNQLLATCSKMRSSPMAALLRSIAASLLSLVSWVGALQAFTNSLSGRLTGPQLANASVILHVRSVTRAAHHF